MAGFKILSIDGGGIRGILPAYWLAKLEEELKRRANKLLVDVFDLFAGTSTGSIIAAGLATGKTADEILKLYMTQAGRIFPKSLWIDPRRFWRLLRPGYDGVGLDQVLAEQFSTIKLGEVKKRLLVTTFNGGSRTLLVFDSQRGDQQGLSLADICRASSSAPTYFPAKVLEIDKVPRPLLDGGMAANNPSALALAKAFQAGHLPNNILLASLGTGASERAITVKQGTNRGAMQWALPIVGVCFDGGSETNEELIRQVLPLDSYFRFQKWCLEADPSLDRSDSAHLLNLQRAAADYLEKDAKDRFGQLLDALLVQPPFDLGGLWTSEYTWKEDVNGQMTELRDTEVVELKVNGKVVSGETIRDQGRFPSRFLGTFDGADVEGTWRSLTTSLHGVFYWRVNINTNNEILGHWIGKGDRLFAGDWKLTRKTT